MKNFTYFNESQIEELGITSVFGKSEYLKSQSNHFGGIKSGCVRITFSIKEPLKIKRATITSFQIKKNSSEADYNAGIDRALDYLKNQIGIAFITSPPSYIVFPFKYNRGENAEFGSVVNNLTLPKEEIFKNLHGKNRNVIRKAQKDGLVVEKGEHLKENCYKIISDTLKKEKVYFESQSEYLKVCNSINKNVEYFVVKKDGEIHRAAVIPFDSECAFYLWGGSINRTSSGAMNFMHWMIILHFKGLNVKQYDFVGVRLNPDKESKLYGLKRFKTRFGGDNKTGFLWKAKLKPFHTFVFHTLYLLKTRSKHSDIIDNISK